MAMSWSLTSFAALINLQYTYPLGAMILSISYFGQISSRKYLPQILIYSGSSRKDCRKKYFKFSHMKRVPLSASEITLLKSILLQEVMLLELTHCHHNLEHLLPMLDTLQTVLS